MEKFVYWMACKRREETQLPMNIWIDESGHYAEAGGPKRIKFQLDRADLAEVSDGKVGDMDLDGKVCPANLVIESLEASDLRKLRNFVRNNRYALERIADQDVHIFQIWADIIKGGGVASDEMIAALKRKVDKVAECESRLRGSEVNHE